MAKSLRTAFIRVTAVNNTEKGLVTYSIDDLRRILSDWNKSYHFKYYLIAHESDKDDLVNHYHIVCDFPTAIRFSTVKNRFPYGDIRPTGSLKTSVRYLIHKDSQAKIQYSEDSIITNCPNDLANYLLDEPKAPDYIKLIMSGEIKEHQQYDLIPFSYHLKNYTKIDRAFCLFREKSFMDKTRKIKVIFLYGDSGTGKSTFVHQFAKKNNLSLCPSSSSNDPFENYKGEDILFLDDLTPDSFAYTDFLKILDPHYQSTVKSRYHNKHFFGEFIFIASNTRLQDWYYYESPETKKQLFRRVKDMFYFYPTKIEHYLWSDTIKDYEQKEIYPNYVLQSLSNLKAIPALDVKAYLGWKPLK